ncbi:hypothetical protein HK405_009860 [Cladochytrium tenue]|nr:hypothetical protein HK405_009860 [Cladochytrium tenue]
MANTTTTQAATVAAAAVAVPPPPPLPVEYSERDPVTMALLALSLLQAAAYDALLALSSDALRDRALALDSHAPAAADDDYRLEVFRWPVMDIDDEDDDNDDDEEGNANQPPSDKHIERAELTPGSFDTVTDPAEAFRAADTAAVARLMRSLHALYPDAYNPASLTTVYRAWDEDTEQAAVAVPAGGSAGAQRPQTWRPNPAAHETTKNQPDHVGDAEFDGSDVVVVVLQRGAGGAWCYHDARAWSPDAWAREARWRWDGSLEAARTRRAARVVRAAGRLLARTRSTASLADPAARRREELEYWSSYDTAIAAAGGGGPAPAASRKGIAAPTPVPAGDGDDEDDSYWDSYGV